MKRVKRVTLTVRNINDVRLEGVLQRVQAKGTKLIVRKVSDDRWKDMVRAVNLLEPTSKMPRDVHIQQMKNSGNGGLPHTR